MTNIRKKINLINSELLNRHIPIELRYMIIKKYIENDEILLKECLDTTEAEEYNFDDICRVYGEVMCKKMLNKIGFEKFNDINQSYCYLYSNILKIMNYLNIQSMKVGVNRYINNLYHVLSKRVIDNLDENIINFIYLNKSNLNYDVEIIKNFKELSKTINDNTSIKLKKLTEYLNKYYIPQNLKDKLGITIIKHMKNEKNKKAQYWMFLYSIIYDNSLNVYNIIEELLKNNEVNLINSILTRFKTPTQISSVISFTFNKAIEYNNKELVNIITTKYF